MNIPHGRTFTTNREEPDWGELERAFGVARIKRVAVPEEWSRTGSGRRFFVFPDLADFGDSPDDDNIQLTLDILRQAEKKLVLTPSQAEAEKIAEELDISEAERFEVKQGSDFADFRGSGQVYIAGSKPIRRHGPGG